MAEDEAPDQQREFTKATVYLPDWQLERFLEFCETELQQMPELSRLPPESLNGYREFFALLAEQEDGRLHRDLPPESRN